MNSEINHRFICNFLTAICSIWPLAQHMQQQVKSACTEELAVTALLTNIYPYVLPHLSSQHLCYQILNKLE